MVRVPRMVNMPAEPIPLITGEEVQKIPATILEPTGIVTLVCTHCEVRWRGKPSEPCWSCGAQGRQPSGTVLFID